MTSALIEAAARALADSNSYEELLAAVAPLIRAAALEEAAQIVEGEPFCSTSEWLNDQIAAAIRSLKEQP
jgi:hypothetical protein